MDKSPVVAGAVLAGAIHLATNNAEVIKRWTNEVQEAINSKNPMASGEGGERAGRMGMKRRRGVWRRRSLPALVLGDGTATLRFAGPTTRTRTGARPLTSCPPVLPCLCTHPLRALLQVQFQAVALMHALRANDRLAVSKLVTQLTRSNVRSPMAQCLLVRYVAQVMAESQVRTCGRWLLCALLPLKEGGVMLLGVLCTEG